MARRESSDIRDFILNEVEQHPKDIARVTAERFQISRPAVTKRLRQLLDEGLLRASGETRARIYAAVDKTTVSETLPIAPGLAEDRVWKDFVAENVDFRKSNMRRICHYGFTEMFNNVLDHSESERVFFEVKETVAYVDMVIRDFGVGIFKKIKDAWNLVDERDAISELLKGKVSTDRERHSGEGIFFTSRVFDVFAMTSGSYYLCHMTNSEDWLLEERPDAGPGTGVRMKIAKNTTRELREVFDRFSSADDPGFSKTHFPIALATYGEDSLVSRSQAKRVLARLDSFSEVLLDFEGVESIGQAFADEIFRVFRKKHPEIKIVAAGANPSVQRMITRALANSGEST